MAGEGWRITLTINEIKDIIKLIRSLENRGILLKGTTRKTASQGFLNFLRPLMAAGLPLMKNVLTPLAKSIRNSSSCNSCSYLKKLFGPDLTVLIISN